MSEGSRPRGWVLRLTEESARWVQDGVITPDQRKAVLANYPVPADTTRERVMQVLITLGSLLVGVGAMLFFAANWQAIPSAAKVALVLVAVVGCHGGGFYLWHAKGYERLGHGLMFLGCMMYGAGIWLIAQIFNMSSGSSTGSGFLLWVVGVLPLAWAVGSRPMLYLSAALALIWISTGLTDTPFSPTSALLSALILGASCGLLGG